MSTAVRDTSIAAYQTIQVNGMLCRMRWYAYDCLYRHGPMTSSELDVQMKKEGTLEHRSSQPRLNEMRKMGCITELDKVVCSITGTTVYQWDVTSKLPVKPVSTRKNPTKSEILFAQQWLGAVTDYYCYDLKNGYVPDDVQTVLDWLARKGQ